MNSVERKFTVTSEMIEAYGDLIGEKHREGRQVPNGLLCALVNDTVWRSLGDKAVCVSMSITHIKPIPPDTEVTFGLILTAGSDSMGQYMLTIGSDSFFSIGQVTVKVFK